MAVVSEHETPTSWIVVFTHSRWSLVFLFGLCAYLTVSGCLTAPLTQLDDALYITGNPLLRPEHAWSKLITEHVYFQWLPTTMVSYRLNAAVFGLDAAWSFRLGNAIVHAASAWLLLKVLERLGLSRRAALVLAAIWALHPMACESVAWASQRRNVLGFFFGILASYLYIVWYGRVVGIVSSVLAYALALGSCPLALGWLPIFLALEALGGPARFSVPNSPLIFRPTPGTAFRLGPLVLLSALLVWVGLNGYGGALRPIPGGSAFTALLTDTDLFLRYVFNILFPVRLSAMYGVDTIDTLAHATLWINLAVWSVLCGGTIWLGRSRQRTLLGWLWFFGSMGPACNIVAIGYPMQDRYAYLSSIGLLLVVCEALAGLLDSVSLPVRIRTWLPRVALAGYLCFLSVLTVERSALWANSQALMEDAVKKQPQAALAHIFYAREWQRVAGAWRNKSQPEKAREACQRAVVHLEKGLSLPDLYLYNPLYARITLAGNLVEAGASRQAIASLDGALPAPDTPRRPTRNGSSSFTYVDPQFEFTYTLTPESVRTGYWNLSRAYLHAFVESSLPSADAEHLLREAAKNGDNALAILPGPPESQCNRACILMAEETFAQEDLSREDAMALARARAHRLEPELLSMCRIGDVRIELNRPASRNRLRALGYLGMARVQFEALLKGTVPPAEKPLHIQEAVAWAQRAGTADPTLGVSFFYLSRIQYFLYETARKQGDDALAERQRQDCIATLKRVPAGSASYTAAQKNLQALAAR